MAVKILGLDPGLRRTGWGLVSASGGNYKYLDSGVIKPNEKSSMAERLAELYNLLEKIITTSAPDYCGIEETFVNKNSATSLKLSQARGVILASIAMKKIPLKEFSPNNIKKALTGAGHADKEQIDRMLRMLLSQMPKITNDESDALACAICCGNNLSSFKYNK